MEVPTATSLKDIYPEDAVDEQVKRWESLVQCFKKEFGDLPEFVARSPGRVNLIGEHIDYSLYSVLPLAITVDLILAVRVRPGTSTIRITNVNDSKFGRREFNLPEHGDPEIDHTIHEWSNYFKCGLRGVTELMKRKKGEKWKSVGMDIVADGTVPSGGGLSSSGAFVCTSALSVMKANGEEIVDKRELTELAIVSERAVGVNSGGMDQSASVFGEKGSALYISFKPSLTATPVSFPDTGTEITFLVAQSFVTSDKQVTGPVCYNLRVVECSMAACFLAKIFGLKRPLPVDNGPLGVSLRGFHDTYFEEKEGVADNTAVDAHTFEDQLDKLLHLVSDYLHQEDGYTRKEICEVLGISVEELQKQFESKFKVRAERFKLRQRALHVFSEALRVLRFKELLVNPPKDVSGDQLLKDLGDLMNETQDSCRDVYECSCPEIDEICKIARGAGAYGSRLTGAGWGGCSVHLVPKEKVEAVTKALTEKYYRKRWPDISEERLREAVVVSKPGAGSFVLKISGEKVV